MHLFLLCRCMIQIKVHRIEILLYIHVLSVSQSRQVRVL